MTNLDNAQTYEVTTGKRDLERLTRSGVIVQHFKREMLISDERKTNKYLYKIICTCIDCNDTSKQYVIYQAMYGDFAIYLRPYEEFTSEVDRMKYPDAKQKYRFEVLRSW